MIFSFDGHHGTSFDSAKEIISSNYELSKGNDEWLGDGVYFFVTGVSTKTSELAEKWAIAQSWDNDKKYNPSKCVFSNSIIKTGQIK
ncbi:hypothetical protein SDC9_105517 [bioreactor metagenome]|uniref:Uncharacterized protein n=1 Tax=bioreactor metagenome TaxID=1076179 RepID=A0A645BAH3_9ZZZZ